MRGRLIATGILLGLCTVIVVACSNRPTKEEALEQSIKNEIVKRKGDRVTQVIGPYLAEGPTALAAAQKYIDSNAARHSVAAADLKIIRNESSGKTVQPIMYDRKTGTYKYSAVKYRQLKDGIPVFRSEMRMLVRNTANSPVVMVDSTLRDLKGFQPPTALLKSKFKGINGQIVGGRDRTDFKGKALASVDSELTAFSTPEPIIWAGLPDSEETPRMAVTFIGDNHNDKSRLRPERWRFVADQQTGEILYRESLIVFTNVTGTVNGLVTEGAGAMECGEELPTPMPYARVSIEGGASAVTSATGEFSILNTGDDEVTVVSGLSGNHFYVQNMMGTDDTLYQTVTPPEPVWFMHNALNTDANVTAQANAYAMANEVRDWALQYNPDYPGLSTQMDFPVFVNNSDGYCPGNAWYDGQSINFCASSYSYANTAFASVVQHEYGHHMVQMAGSAQDEYGEGMADVVSMLIHDDSGLGLGFFLDDCENPLRIADNDCQYDENECSSCGTGIHDCGQLLSGIVWSIRNELINAGVEDYLDLLSGIVVNSILMHDSGRIDERIAADFLTLDDDDGNLGNGSPHWDQICSGFNAHGIACPELRNFLSVDAPVSVTENDGVLPGAVTVSLAWAIEEDLVVFVASGDISEAEVAGYGIIPAGALSATLDLTVIDDAILDGTQTVRLVALAPDMVQGEARLQVHDNETAALSLTLPTEMMEGMAYTAAITVDTPVDEDIAVTLLSDDSGELSVPAEVIVPMGETSVTFDVTAVNDMVFDGATHVSLTAFVENWTSAEADTVVTDDLRVQLTLPGAVREGAGVLHNAGLVEVSGILENSLSVSLVSSDETELTVPLEVVIPAGAYSAMFELVVIDDAIIDGNIEVEVASGAGGFIDDSAVIQVMDNDPGALMFGEDAYTVSEDADSVTVTIIREPSSVGAISVNYETMDDMAVAGEDYLATSGTVTFLQGETVKTFEVPLLQDEITEGNEMLILMLSSPTNGGVLGSPNIAQLWIADDDIPDFFTEGFGWNDGGGEYPEPDSDSDSDSDMDADSDSDMGDGLTKMVTVTTKNGLVTVTPDFDLSYRTLTLTPDGSYSFYSPCETDAVEFPVNPEGGTPLILEDDDSREVQLPEGQTVSLYGVNYSGFYVGSNGYITFNEPDWNYRPDFSAHFRLPRISALRTDLDPMWEDWEPEIDTALDSRWEPGDKVTPPSVDDSDDFDTAVDTDPEWPLPGEQGPISVLILEDRVAVTYDNVTVFGGGIYNSFQIEMFFDGVIRITWLNIEAYFGIVGISEGLGQSPMFVESDLTSYGSCINADCQTDADCADDIFCNGNEVCISGECVAGGDVVCDDTVACTQDVCSEDAKGCAVYPDDTQCDDGNACTMDVCDAALGCIFVPIAGCCGDGVCDGGETFCDCPGDCGEPAATEAGLCDDGIDNDCDGVLDDADEDCACFENRQQCRSDADCCSGRCRGQRPANRRCR